MAVKVKVRHGEIEVAAYTPSEISVFIGPLSTTMSSEEARALALVLSVVAEKSDKLAALKLQNDWVEAEYRRRVDMYRNGTCESGHGKLEECG